MAVGNSNLQVVEERTLGEENVLAIHGLKGVCRCAAGIEFCIGQSGNGGTLRNTNLAIDQNPVDAFLVLNSQISRINAENLGSGVQQLNVINTAVSLFHHHGGFIVHGVALPVGNGIGRQVITYVLGILNRLGVMIHIGNLVSNCLRINGIVCNEEGENCPIVCKEVCRKCAKGDGSAQLLAIGSIGGNAVANVQIPCIRAFSQNKGVVLGQYAIIPCTGGVLLASNCRIGHQVQDIGCALFRIVKGSSILTECKGKERICQRQIRISKANVESKFLGNIYLALQRDTGSKNRIAGKGGLASCIGRNKSGCAGGDPVAALDVNDFLLLGLAGGLVFVQAS